MTVEESKASSPETAAAVLDYITRNPTCSLRAIGDALGVGPSTAHRAVQRLLDGGDLQIDRRGSSRGYVSSYLVGSIQTPEMMTNMPNTPGTPRRTIRVEDGLWEAAAAKAAEQGTDVSAVIRKALERYVRSGR